MKILSYRDERNSDERDNCLCFCHTKTTLLNYADIEIVEINVLRNERKRYKTILKLYEYTQ